MGTYAEYLNKFQSFDEIATERKKILENISKLRENRDMLMFVSDLSKNEAPIGIEYTDLLAVQD